MATKKHWTPADFQVTETTPAYDGSATLTQFGYCRKCFGDMQAFGRDGKLGVPLHYSSHKTAKRIGLWGKR